MTPNPNRYPAVSVIVPCYLTTAFIAETLDSLRAQTFRNFETILVNDGCPDTANLERVLKPYRNEIIYLKQENRGLAGARNTGILAAHAPLIALLDSDDVWMPNYLQVQVGYLKRHPEVDVVYPNAVYFGETTWAGRIFRDVFPSRGEVTVSSLLTGECRINVCVTARRQAVLDVAMFDADLRSAEDWELWLRMAKAGSKFKYHEQILYQYRVRKGSLSSDKLSLPRSAVTVLKKFLDRHDLTDEEREVALKSLRKYEALINWVLGRIALYRGNRDEALFHLTQAKEEMKTRRLQVALLLLRIAPQALFRLVRHRYATECEFLH